jgi:DNA-directed RNA polymerase subunit N (RpoN/RPB10)
MDTHQATCFGCGRIIGHLFADRSWQAGDFEERQSFMATHGIRRSCCKATLLTSFTANPRLKESVSDLREVGPSKYIRLSAATRRKMYAEDGRPLEGDTLSLQVVPVA